MNKPLIGSLGFGLSLITAASLSSRSGGLLESDLSNIPNLVRQAPSCGECHFNTAGSLMNLQISQTTSKVSLDPGETISVTTSSIGGNQSTRAGFVAETTGGSFASQGNDTQVRQSGAFVTHAPFGLNQRSWSYDLTAPQAPGVVELYTAVNTTNANFNTVGDVWGVNGPDAGAQLTTPVRVFVNAPGVTEIGPGCVDVFGNQPVLGSDELAQLGNGNFSFSVVNAPANSVGSLLLGTALPFGFPLDFIGMPGCSLFVERIIFDLPFVTGAGSSERAEGVATIPLSIPNDPSIAGFVGNAQVIIINPANPLGIISTNGVRVNVQ